MFPRAFLNLFFALLLCSCSYLRLPSFKKDKSIPKLGYKLFDKTDYIEHLKSLKDQLFQTGRVKKLILSPEIEKYLVSLVKEIEIHNEIFLKEQKIPEYYIIQSTVPFHFSLPGRIIYFSSGLINKYIKNESILASIISFELVRSEKLLYNKVILIPKGFVELDQILSLNRIETDEKIEIHKWAYYLTKRAGFDGEYYLSWLQVQNRNTTDFIPFLGFTSGISKEEAYFKAFLVKENKENVDTYIARKESSKNFYKFLFYIKDKSV
jgi:hypothetical protein